MKTPSAAKIQLYMLCAEYTRRFQTILAQLPWQVVFSNARGDDIKNAGERERVGGLLHAYFDLCAEQLFLFEAGMIPAPVWAQWKLGMAGMFKLPAVGDAWSRVSEVVRYNDLKALLQSMTGTS